MFKKASLPFLGFLQASGVFLYLILISTFISYIAPGVDQASEKFYGPIMVLMLFILSAVITASLVLARAGMLFYEKKYKESFTLITWTSVWGFVYFLIVLFKSTR